MKNNRVFIGVLVIVSVISIVLFFPIIQRTSKPVDSSSTTITLTGTYVCLPLLDKMKTASEECVFGLLTDGGVYYMVNFGSSASAMKEFQDRKRITAKGFVALKETLNTDHWANYNMKGILTITERR